MQQKHQDWDLPLLRVKGARKSTEVRVAPVKIEGNNQFIFGSLKYYICIGNIHNTEHTIYRLPYWHSAQLS